MNESLVFLFSFCKYTESWDSRTEVDPRQRGKVLEFTMWPTVIDLNLETHKHLLLKCLQFTPVDSFGI